MKDKIGKYLIREKTRYDSIKGQEKLQVYGVSNVDGITKTQHKRSKDLSKYLVIRKGFFAYNPYRINVGSIGLTPEGKEGLVSPAYIVFRTDENKLLPELLLDYLKSKEGLRQIKKHSRGTVRKALRFEDLSKIEMPILEIEKQREILKRKKFIDKGVELLSSAIETQEKDLHNLSQQILQHAVSGKLSEQWRKENPDIESAELLLEKIKTEKAKLIKEGKIRKGKSLSAIRDEEIPFELPEGWVWCRLGEIIRYTENLNIQKELKPSQIINYLDIDAIDNSNQIIREIKKTKVSELSSRARRVLKRGYIAYSKVRPYLKNMVIIEEEHDLFIGSTGLNVFKPIDINTKYIFYYLLSAWVNKKFWEDMVGFNSPSINNTQFESLLVPLPQVSEQDFIVERIESLFSKVDLIKELNSENNENIDLLNQIVLQRIFEE
jgi:type I restriction enzyme, S subunit